MKDFEKGLQRYFSAEQLARIQQQTVGIAGAGGLGSNVAMLLVRSGFCHFILADFDVVSVSNLNRQNYFFDQLGKKKAVALAENLRRIQPALDIKIFAERLVRTDWQEVFQPADLLVEALDDAELKAAFVEDFAERGRFLVSASGLAGCGRSDRIRTRKLSRDFVVVGDEMSGIELAPPLAPAVMLAAAKEADAVLEYVLKGAMPHGTY